MVRRICNIVILILLCQPLHILASTDCCVNNTTNSNGGLSEIIIAFGAAIISAVVSWMVVRATRFNDSVTKARSRYIEEFRQMAAAFLAHATEDCMIKEKKDVKSKCERDEKTIRYCYYRLLLMLNPTKPCSYWDRDIIERMTRLVNSSPHKSTDKEVQDFVLLLQSDLDLEWHGMMEEGKSGILGVTDKEKLRLEYYLNFKNSIK